MTGAGAQCRRLRFFPAGLAGSSRPLRSKKLRAFILRWRFGPAGARPAPAAILLNAVPGQPRRACRRRCIMAAIGFVNGTIEEGFSGQLRTLSIRAAIEVRPNRSKSLDVQPDYRIYSEEVEIGAGWIRVGEVSGKAYVSLSLAAPEFGPRRIYANLGRAAGQDDDRTYAILWNPVD
jgi:uncharacterized protein (DUF736 family)